jgi:hypothetical protein
LIQSFFMLNKTIDFFAQIYIHLAAFWRVMLSDHTLGTILKYLLTGEIKMVGVAQLVERQVVALLVAGSSPVTHPILYGAIV